MATVSGVGPEREQYALTDAQKTAFNVIVECSTYNVDRLILSNAIRACNGPQGIFVIDGFHRTARKIWRIAPRLLPYSSVAH